MDDKKINSDENNASFGVLSGKLTSSKKGKDIKADDDSKQIPGKSMPNLESTLLNEEMINQHLPPGVDDIRNLI